MKSIPFFIVAVLSLLVILRQPVSGKWERTSGPYGGNVERIVVLENGNVLANACGGVFLSENSGLNWTEVNCLGFRTITHCGSKVVAGGVYGVCISFDFGKNWETVLLPATYERVGCIALNDSVIYLSASSAGNCNLFKTADNGLHWCQIPVTPNQSGEWILSIVECGANLFIITQHQIKRSIDQGMTWTYCPSNDLPYEYGNIRVDKLHVVDTVLFATGKGVYRSVDYGATWTAVMDRDPRIQIFEVAETGIIYAGVLGSKIINDSIITNDSIYFSSDTGSTWKTLNADFSGNRIKCLGVNRDGTRLFAGTTDSSGSGGVYLSTNSGFTWAAVNTGISCLTISCLEENGNRLFAGVCNVGIYMSDDYGVSWNIADIGLKKESVLCIDAAGKDSIFAGTSQGKVFLSTNNGASWTLSCSGIATSEVITAIFAQGNGTVYAGTNRGKGVYRSTNAGIKWGPINNGLTEPMVQDFILLGNYIFLANAIFEWPKGSCIYRLSPLGWKQMGSGIEKANIASSFVAYAGKLFTGTDKGVFTSKDTGNTWSEVDSGGIIKDYCIDDILCYKETLFATANCLKVNSTGVFTCKLTEQTWKNVNEGLPVLMLGSYLTTCGDYLYAGTHQNGIWRRPLSEMTDVKDSGPKKTSLSQINLKVFSTGITGSLKIITFHLPRRERVDISLYGPAGQKISSILSAFLEPGAHGFTWNCGGVAVGCYTICLWAGKHSYIKKVTILH